MDHVFGNCRSQQGGERGWFVGHFLDPADGLRASGDVEVKWGEHAAGDERSGWSRNRQATTISILISGRFRISFPDGDVVLAERGDYALWAPAVAHHWRAEQDCVIVTVRWPSVPDDSESIDVGEVPLSGGKV